MDPTVSIADIPQWAGGEAPNPEDHACWITQSHIEQTETVSGTITLKAFAQDASGPKPRPKTLSPEIQGTHSLETLR